MNRRISLLAVLIVWVASITHAKDALVEQPARAFGYFIGDVLEQRINLGTEPVNIVEPDLDTGQRVGSFLWRMPGELYEQQHGRQDRQWLVLRYQIINVPPTADTINLPALTLKTQSGAELTVAEWPFVVSPLTHYEDTDSVPILLPNRTAAALLPSHDNAWLLASFVGLLATLSLWLLWWLFRCWRDSHTLPFANAYRLIRRLPAARIHSEPDAWVALHHAFNAVAGKTISIDSVSELFVNAPWLAVRQPAIEQFYTASAARFFQQSETSSIEAVDVKALCADLSRLEKRQAKSQVKPARTRL